MSWSNYYFISVNNEPGLSRIGDGLRDADEYELCGEGYRRRCETESGPNTYGVVE